MKLARFSVLVALLSITLNANAQTPQPKAAEPEYRSDWAYCTAITVMERFETLYLPHALALMDAEQKLRGNADPAQVEESLSKLPGVLKTVIADNRNAQHTSEAKFDSALLAEPRFFKTFKSPMMHKLLGGKCMWENRKFGGKKHDLIVRGFFPVADDTVKRVVIALILDESWLLPQIPMIMDSLARENTQLLFWGPSPTNTFWAQTLGIVSDKDTLWWQGPKDVEVEVMQILWPFENIQIHSHLHKMPK